MEDCKTLSMQENLLKRLFLISLLLGGALCSFGQRYVVAPGGSWSSTSTWSSTRGGASGASVPSSLDDVYTDGNFVTIAGGTNAVCNNLYVRDVTNSVRGGSGTNTLTISGELATLDSFDGYVIPVNSVIQSSSSLTYIFTASGQDAVNVEGWSTSCAIRRVTFSPGSGNTITLPTFVVAANGTLTVSSGTLNLTGNLQGGSGSSIVVNSGAALRVSSGTISGDGTNSTSFPALTVNTNGTVISQSNSTAFINADIITLSSGSTLNVGYNGANQTQGWWYQSTAPTTVNVDPASTVIYSSSSSQNIFAQTYGNLTLGGTGTLTKTVAGSGSININGNLTFNNTGITLNIPAANQVVFNGTGSQSINGGGTANFNGGLQLNKSAGTLTLSQSINVQNGITLTSGTFDLGSNTLSLAGNLVNNATLLPSTSTLSVISGSTTISGSSATSLSNLSITGTGSLVAPASLTISGNFSNSGTFNANNGTVTFNGSTAQSLTGTATFNNINCNSTGGVGVNGTINLGGTLTLNSSGVFDADGSGSGVFTILSTSVNTGGAIAALPTPANFSGNVTIQRFIHSQSGGDYRYISVPITTNNNLGLVQSAIGVTGNFSDRSTNAQFANIVDAGNTNPSVFTFNGTSYVAVNGSGGTVASTALSSRVGYVAYNFNNGNATASYRGQIETGNNVQVSISGTSGNYNLVPNPFPSPIDWDIVTKTNVNNAIWLRTGNNTFSSYVNGVATLPPFGGWTGEVATGQAFWTQSNGGGTTLTFKEADKTSNAYQFLRQDDPVNYFRIKLESGTQMDDAVIRFSSDGSDGFDASFDAYKRKNGNYVSALGANNYVNISSFTGAVGSPDYSINTVGLINCSKSVSLKIADAAPGNYTLSFSETEKMQLGYTMMLVDNFAQKSLPITENTSYGFSISSDPNSTGNNRFLIRFDSPVVPQAVPTYSLAGLCTSQIELTFQTNPGITYQIKSASNTLTTVDGNGNQVTVLIDRSKLSSGDNFLDLMASSSDNCNSKAFPSAFLVSLQDTPTIANVTSDIICNTGSTTLVATGAPANGSYRWYSGDDLVNPIQGQVGDKLITPVISQTTQFYVSALNSTGCEGPKTLAVASVSTLEKPKVSVDGLVLSSSSPTGNQWLKDGLPINSATESTFKVYESGVYSVKVTNSSQCAAVSDNLVLSINGVADSPTSIWVYPNPALDKLFIKIPAAQAEELTSIKVLDSKGATMSSTKFVMDSFENDALDISDLSAGMYYVSLSFGSQIRIVRFIKK